MKIIVLAAGMGERLMPLTRSRPKSLLEVGEGRTLLAEQLRRMRESAVIDECVYVVGYLADQIEAALDQEPASPMQVRTVFNPFFGVSNNLASLWLARAEMNGDFMVTNGDCLFPPEIHRDLVAQSGPGVGLCVNVKQGYDDDDMKVVLRDGMVAQVSKLIPTEAAHAESPGLAIVRGEAANRDFRGQLESLIRRPDMLDRFWLEVFNALVTAGGRVHPWTFPRGTNWREVDFHLDLDIIRSVLRLGDL